MSGFEFGEFTFSDPTFLTVNSTGIVTVDISECDYLSVALPDFPSSSIDLSQSFLDITSHPAGDFSPGSIDAIPFSSSSPALPGSNGDAELRISLSLLTVVDLTAITGVRFRIYATSDCSFRAMAIRACSDDWTYAPIDLDTLYDRIHHPPPPNGELARAFDFPPTADSSMPTDFPIVFRSDDTSGRRDPQPIDLSVSSHIYTGSLTASDDNAFALYFREIPLDDQIQLELDEITQAELDVLGVQPDYGVNRYVGRPQSNLETQTQDQLDDDTQFDLERLPDYSSNSWLEVRLTWNDSGTILTVLDADSVGHTFTDLPVISEVYLVMMVDLVEDMIRVRLYSSDATGIFAKPDLIYDTTEIRDDILIKRRKGRFGWWAQLSDGDALIENVRLRDANFGEFVSKKFESNTPVDGVNLNAGSSADRQLFTELQAAYWGIDELTIDPSASKSGKAYKIVNRGGRGIQGVMTNPFLLDALKATRISFNINFPKAALTDPTSGLEAFLFGEYDQIIPVRVSALSGGSWERVGVSFRNDLIQTGTFRLVLIQSLANVETTWYLDNIVISNRLVDWTARGNPDDAWHMVGDEWMPANDILNQRDGGVVFQERGTGLQVRGRALRQSAEIHEMKLTPKYAGLGRFFWPDEAPDMGDAPVPIISSSVIGQRVSFDATGSTDTEGLIIAYFWSFGDDTYDFGPQARHTYDLAGDYVVTLTVVDKDNNRSSTTATVTV